MAIEPYTFDKIVNLESRGVLNHYMATLLYHVCFEGDMDCAHGMLFLKKYYGCCNLIFEVFPRMKEKK
jgi:hypothetical protein